MRTLLLSILCLIALKSFSQTKNFIDQPYLETTATADSLVVPDRIYLSIIITEKDTRGRTSVEELENKMEVKLKSLGVNTDTQLSLSDLGSNFKRYFLKKTDVLKSKAYQLLVYDGLTAGKVIQGLESIGISNVDVEKTEYSKIEELKMELKREAVMKAKRQAETMLEPLGQKLGNAIFISDTQTNIANALQGRVGGVAIYGYSSPKESFLPLKVEFEKIKVESTVNINFVIKE